MVSYSQRDKEKSGKLGLALSTIVLVAVFSAFTGDPSCGRPHTTPPPPAGPTSFSVTDLGTLGGTFAQATGIDARGQVTGFSTIPGDTTTHGFRWGRGVMTDLGTLGGNNSAGHAIDFWGRASGEGETATADPISGGLESHAFLWRLGKIRDLGTLGGNNSAGIGISGRGQVVGASEIVSIDPNTGILAFHAFLWEGGVMTDLGTLGGVDSAAGGINPGNLIVGASQTIVQLPPPHQAVSSPTHATSWFEGKATDLGTLGGKESQAFAVNYVGQIVGFANLAGDTTFHAFLWHNGVMQDLGTLDQASQAFAVNNFSAQVVGASGSASQPLRAFIWQDNVMTDLNTRVPANSGWQLTEAVGINHRGEIAGWGTHNGFTHAFLLTPVDPSSTTRSASAPEKEDTAHQNLKVELPEHLQKLTGWQKPGLERFQFGRTTPK